MTEYKKDVSRNVVACFSVASILRTTLGPSGRDKMLVFPDGSVFISNDGAFILKQLDIQHPAAMVELAKGQDQAVGDGTTSVVILATELMKQWFRMLEMGIHPSKIANVVGFYSDHFASLTLAALEAIESSGYLLKNVHIVKKVGQSMGDSKFIDGIIIDHEVDLGSQVCKTKAKVLVTRLDLQFWTTKIWGANSKLQNNNTQLKQQLSQNERTKLRELCALIAKAGVDVLINQGEIFPVAAEALNEESIMYFSIQDQELLEMTAKAVHGGIISDLDNIEFVKNQLGYADIVEQVTLENEKFIQISGCSTPSKPSQVCSLLLVAPNKMILEECERSVHDCLSILVAASKTKLLIGGAGSMYIELQKFLRKEAALIGSSIQLIYEAFADALQIIPLTLAQNADFDAPQLLAQLKKAHHEEDGLWKGLDLEKGTIVDIISSVVEPIDVMLSILQSATEAAVMILRIDQNIFHAPRKPFIS